MGKTKRASGGQKRTAGKKSIDWSSLKKSQTGFVGINFTITRSKKGKKLLMAFLD